MEFNGQYLTYVEYKELGGTLSEMPFNLLEFQARKEIDKYTFGRLQDLTSQNQEVKLCINELIPKIDGYNSDIKKGIASENTNGYSVTYNGGSKEQEMARINEIKDIIYSYLANSKLEDGTPYLYRGK